MFKFQRGNIVREMYVASFEDNFSSMYKCVRCIYKQICVVSTFIKYTFIFRYIFPLSVDVGFIWSKVIRLLLCTVTSTFLQLEVSWSNIPTGSPAKVYAYNYSNLRARSLIFRSVYPRRRSIYSRCSENSARRGSSATIPSGVREIWFAGHGTWRHANRGSKAPGAEVSFGHVYLDRATLRQRRKRKSRPARSLEVVVVVVGDAWSKVDSRGKRDASLVHRGFTSRRIVLSLWRGEHQLSHRIRVVDDGFLAIEASRTRARSPASPIAWPSTSPPTSLNFWLFWFVEVPFVVPRGVDTVRSPLVRVR